MEWVRPSNITVSVISRVGSFAFALRALLQITCFHLMIIFSFFFIVTEPETLMSYEVLNDYDFLFFSDL